MREFKASMTTKKAVAYCRVSSLAQLKKGHGLESQATRCREYAQMKGYELIKVFQDEAVSGGAIDRPGMKEMLSYLRKNRKDGIYVVIDDISRLARGVEAHIALRGSIAMAGGGLENPSILFGGDADSELQEYIMATVSQHQRRKNAEQTKQRMRARSMNGYWCLRTCLGFRYQASKGEGKILVRDEPIASIIQEALEGYASGRFSMQAEVKRFLETQPAFPRNKYGLVRNQLVNDILTRALYAGYIEVPTWGISLRKGRHEGLIDLATWNRIQERLQGKAKAPARADINAKFPLRGFVLCGDCEHPMTSCDSTSKTGAKHAYYMCFKKGCVSYRKSIRKAEMEGRFETLLQSISPTKTMFDLTKAMFSDAWAMQAEKSELMKTSFKRKIASAEKQIAGFLTRLVDADAPSVIKAYESRIGELEREKLVWTEKMQNMSAKHRPFSEMFELAFAFLANPYSIWENGQLAEKRTALKLTFSEPLIYHRNQGFRTPKTSYIFSMLGAIQTGVKVMAERQGFEPWERSHAQRFSRPPHSTTLAPLREGGKANDAGNKMQALRA